MAKSYDKFMVAPQGFTDGLETDKQPWLISDQAFSELNNAYVFRGRVRKRFGSYLMGDRTQKNSRLRVIIGTTNEDGDLAPTVVPGNQFKVGQMFSVGDDLFTVNVVGTPANLLSTDITAAGTYNTTTGSVTLDATVPETAVYFYPATPVMGITQYEDGVINNWPTFAFDTQFAYEFAGGGWTRSANPDGTPVWHGTDDQLFWAANWRGILASTTLLFVTNFNSVDPMWYFDGSTWTSFTPIFLTGGNYVKTARIIIPFQKRLLLFNTIESTSGGDQTTYRNRCRFSHVGSPVDVNSFLEPNQSIVVGPTTFYGDGGGFLDATTREEIVSAKAIKNRLIVYFERSTWEIVYTNNETNPFLWQKINTELGSEALLSTVPFDTAVLTIGNTGIHACSGNNVERIDNKIPQKIFQLNSTPEGSSRIVGIRDYFVEMVYWALPYDNQASTAKFPNKILVYNYENASWAFNDDSVTAFGYFEQQDDVTWETANFTWQSSGETWISGVTESKFRQIIAGNQEGFMFVVSTETYRNAAALQITDITADSMGNTILTIINHNISQGNYILVEDAQGTTAYNGVIMKVLRVIDDNKILVNAGFSAGYTGGGTVAQVSNVQILSKQWNPYVNQGNNLILGMIDFYVGRTDSGAVTVDYYASSTSLSLIDAGQGTGALLGNNSLSTAPYALAPFEKLQTRLWHTVYFQTSGECIQIYIYYSDDQIVRQDISLVNFELSAMILYCMRITRIA